MPDQDFTDPEEQLLRQVSPNYLVDGGVPSSQAFYPWREVDDGCLSVDRRTLTTPEESFALFTAPRPSGMEGNSAGVWSVTVAEIIAQGTRALPDPVLATADGPANPAHALVDFRALPSPKWKKVAQRLKAHAIARGPLYRPAA